MEGLMRRLVLGVLIVLAVAVPARAQGRIDIGIQLPGPPALVVIPGAPVYYAPRAPANVFFYGDQYWLFHGNGWYAGSTWNGPWVVVEPVYLPAPILRVPVRYYHVRPRDWREREERWHHDKHKGRKHDERHDRSKRGRGHDK